MEIYVSIRDERRDDYYSSAKITDEAIHLHGPNPSQWFPVSKSIGNGVYLLEPSTGALGMQIGDIRGNDIYVLESGSGLRKRAVIRLPEIYMLDGSDSSPYAKLTSSSKWPFLTSNATKGRLMGAAAATMLFLGTKSGEWYGR